MAGQALPGHADRDKSFTRFRPATSPGQFSVVINASRAFLPALNLREVIMIDPYWVAFMMATASGFTLRAIKLREHRFRAESPATR